MKKLSIIGTLFVFMFIRQLSAQPFEKVTPEINSLIEKIQAGDSRLKQIMEIPSAEKVFPYKYYRNGVPIELKDAGIEKQFKFNTQKKISIDLSGMGYRIFEDGTVLVPVSFNQDLNAIVPTTMEESKQRVDEITKQKEAFINKYNVSYISGKTANVFIVLPLKHLQDAVNDNYIKYVGNNYGVFSIGEQIQGKDIVIGFIHDAIIKKRIVSSDDARDIFVSFKGKKQEDAIRNALGTDYEYLNQIIFSYKGKPDLHQLEKILKNENILEYGIIEISDDFVVVRFPEKVNIFQTVRKLSKYQGVYFKHLGISFILHGASNDTNYNDQWYLANTNSRILMSGQNMDEAWEITDGSDNVAIFIIDSGLYPHSDFKMSRFIMGKDYANNAEMVTDDDYGSYGHGTAIAGLIGAETNNGRDIAGHNQKSKIYVIKIINSDGNILVPDFVNSLNDVLSFKNSNPEKRVVVNLSIRTYTNFSDLENKISELISNDIIIVACAGNGSQSDKITYPAKYLDVIAVGSTNASDSKESYSDYMSTSTYENPAVNIVAPGGNSNDGILSLTSLGSTSNSFWGTSFSTPQVTAAVSLMLSVNNDLTLYDIRDKLFATASKDVYNENGTAVTFTDNYNPKVGFGLLQISEAVKAAIPESNVYSGGSNDPGYPTELELPLNIGKDQIFLVKKEGDGSEDTYYSLNFNSNVNSGGVLIIEKKVKIITNAYHIFENFGGTVIYEDGSAIGTGIEDAVIFYPALNLPNENLYSLSQNMGTVYYSTNFVDQEPLGDYLVGNKTYEMSFYHAGGKYIYSTKTTPVAQQTVSFSITDLPTNFQWERDQDGMVVGKITVSAVDNRGYSHENHLDIVINAVPNKPILATAKPGNGKIKLTYTSNGAASYKINYGTTPQSQPNFVNSAEPECTVTGLQNRTTYYFTIEGINSTGTSLSSDVITRTPLTTTGVLAQNETWPGNGNPNEIELEGDLTISGNTTLTITGTAQNIITLRIPSDSKITVNNSSKIISSFTVFGRLDLSAWNSLFLNGNTNSFTNCLFDGGGSSNQSAVNIRSTGNTFTNCTFSNNYYGIISYWVSSGVRSNFTVNNCIFENNRHGLVISYANASVSNSIFRENKSSGIYVWGSTVNTFSNNKVFSNVTNIANEGNRGGLELMAGSILYMDNNKLNRVWNNKSHEIYLDTDSKLYGSTGKNSIKDAENGHSATGKYIYSLSQTQVGENFINWTVPMSSNYWGGVPASGMFYGSVDFSSHLSIDPTGSGPNPTKVAGEGKQITSVLSSEMYQRTIPDESYSTGGGKGDKNFKPRMVEIRNWLRKNP
ncbi:MAG: S8 family serine peptidase, partial [Bacteroidetes bacterium]|nr:S8 family serine peptidase [Bacteroidota bacterium]